MPEDIRFKMDFVKVETRRKLLQKFGEIHEKFSSDLYSQGKTRWCNRGGVAGVSPAEGGVANEIATLGGDFPLKRVRGIQSIHIILHDIASHGTPL
jgi:hypothetical protein